MEHQIQNGKLPEYEVVRDDLKNLLEKIFEKL